MSEQEFRQKAIDAGLENALPPKDIDMPCHRLELKKALLALPRKTTEKEPGFLVRFGLVNRRPTWRMGVIAVALIIVIGLSISLAAINRHQQQVLAIQIARTDPSVQSALTYGELWKTTVSAEGSSLSRVEFTMSDSSFVIADVDMQNQSVVRIIEQPSFSLAYWLTWLRSNYTG